MITSDEKNAVHQFWIGERGVIAFFEFLAIDHNLENEEKNQINFSRMKFNFTFVFPECY